MLHAFIDESGDDGFSAKSSRWLVLGAYIILESEMPSVKLKFLNGIKEIWKTDPPDHVHFVDCPHTKRKALLNLVKGINLTCMYVGVRKDALGEEAAKRLACPTLYFYLAKHLVERLSWFARDSGMKVRITFAQRSQVSFTELKSYFYDTLIHSGYPTHSIEFNCIDSMGSIPANVNTLLQAADWITGGFTAGLNPDTYDQVELAYAEILWGKYWMRSGKFWSYGMKYIPTTFDRKQEKLFKRIDTWIEDPTTL
jgi:hypothetical protein